MGEGHQFARLCGNCAREHNSCSNCGKDMVNQFAIVFKKRKRIVCGTCLHEMIDDIAASHILHIKKLVAKYKQTAFCAECGGVNEETSRPADLGAVLNDKEQMMRFCKRCRAIYGINKSNALHRHHNGVSFSAHTSTQKDVLTFSRYEGITSGKPGGSNHE